MHLTGRRVGESTVKPEKGALRLNNCFCPTGRAEELIVCRVDFVVVKKDAGFAP